MLYNSRAATFHVLLPHDRLTRWGEELIIVGYEIYLKWWSKDLNLTRIDRMSCKITSNLKITLDQPKSKRPLTTSMFSFPLFLAKKSSACTYILLVWLHPCNTLVVVAIALRIALLNIEKAKPLFILNRAHKYVISVGKPAVIMFEFCDINTNTAPMQKTSSLSLARI